MVDRPIEEIRGERARIVAFLRQEAAAAAGSLPVDRDVAASAIADWIEQGEHEQCSDSASPVKP